MLEFAEAFSKQLEYALSNSHCTTIVSGLKDFGGTYRGEVVISFGPRQAPFGIDRAGGEISDLKSRVGKSLKIRPYGL